MNEVQIKAKGDVSIFGDVVGRDKITINLPQPLPPAEAKDRANLLILLHKVKTFWIEGVLEKSVHNAVLLELGKETKPETVDHPWGMVLELPDQTNQVLPSGTKILEIFEKMNRAMLILGEPGSGKTITLLGLARDLINCAEADPTQPIPVVFNLSSWTDKRQPLHEWLVFELTTKYQIPKRIGSAWLKNNRLLPLLDGLDEVKLENRVSCVEAISHFGETFGLPGCVVCCRIKEYTALTVRLKLNGAICVQPLTFTQVNNYLQAGGNKLAALRSTLQKDEALQELASSPLMLNIMSLAYQYLPIDDVINEIPTTQDNRRSHLFSAYIHRMFIRRGKANQLYTKEQIVGWLSWLAQNMCQHNQTVFLIEQLQPSWLSNRGQQWSYVFISRLMCGLILGSILGLIHSMFSNMSQDYIILIGSTSGLVGGLLLSLIEALRFERNTKSIETDKIETIGQAMDRADTMYLFFLIVAFTLGATAWVITKLSGVQSGAHRIPVLVGLGWGLIWALILGPRITNQNIKNDIQVVEALKWSWKSAVSRFIAGFVIGSIPSIVDYLSNKTTMAIDEWILVALFFGLWGAFFGGLKRRLAETKTVPNQGIMLSIRNSILSGMFFAILMGLIDGFEVWLTRNRYEISFYWMFLGSLASFWFGGIDVIRHYALRFILCCKRYTPWNYARFLDYATSLIFLQKVGGGYIFIHRLLLEHFAAMPLQSKSQKK